MPTTTHTQHTRKNDPQIYGFTREFVVGRIDCDGLTVTTFFVTRTHSTYS